MALIAVSNVPNVARIRGLEIHFTGISPNAPTPCATAMGLVARLMQQSYAKSIRYTIANTMLS